MATGHLGKEEWLAHYRMSWMPYLATELLLVHLQQGKVEYRRTLMHRLQ